MNQPKQQKKQQKKEKLYVQPGKKKGVTIQSVTKHIKNETKKKEDKTAKKVEPVEDPIEKKLKLFCKYYQGISIVPAEEWKTFLKENVGTQYMTFRFLSKHTICPSYPDTVPGIPSQRDVLIDYMKRKYTDSINKMVVDNKTQLSLAPFTWYPNDWGWTMNIDQLGMGKYLGLKDFHFFLASLKSENVTQNLEVWSMLPPLLLRIQPHHKVLDLCASPGFIAGQISEVMHADPNIINEGVLVLNDWHKFGSKMQYNWCKGAKVLFTNEDARTFPDLYINDKNEPMRYDRVICDVKCSNDGTMRKNVGLQDTWYSMSALEKHKEQYGILKRGLELVVPGGLVLYCTTSLNPVENEGVIMGMLKEAAGTVDLVDVSRIVSNFKLRPGMTTWQVMSEEGYFFPSYKMSPDEFQSKYPESVFPPPLKEAKAFHMERCARVLPHDNNSAGFFCALLVKNKELPWIIEAKKAAEAEARAARLAEAAAAKEAAKEAAAAAKEAAAAAKEAAKEAAAAAKEAAKEAAAAAKSGKGKKVPPAPVKPKEPEKKKYGYKIILDPQIALTEIEWTIEDTNRFLQTRTKIERQKFPLPELVINESCIPKKLVDIPEMKMMEVDEAFGYCNPDDPEWIKIKEFFKISDNFDARSLLQREDKHFLFLSSLFVRNLIKLNMKRLNINIFPEAGAKVMHRMRDLWIPCDTTCPYIFTEEGFAALYPHIGKQMVKVTKEDILALAYNEKLKITDLSEMAQNDIKETEQGCILFVYKPKDFSAVPKCNVTFVGARGENYITDFKEGKTTDRKTFFRLCGIEMEDYKRKIQDEKLAKVLEMEREKKLKGESMDTS